MKKLRYDPMTPMCGAKTKRTGKLCQLYPCKNGRCHLHGGHSTGPKSLSGIQRIKQANTKHGHYTKEALREHIAFKKILNECKEVLAEN